MADNIDITPGTGASVRTLDRTGQPGAQSAETQVFALDQGGSAGESLVGPTNPLQVTDLNLEQALENDKVLNTVLRGDPDGDFAGQSLLEMVMNPASGEALNVNLLNAPLKGGVNGGTVLADTAVYTLQVGQRTGALPIIDTTGYNSVMIQFTAASGQFLIQQSGDPAVFFNNSSASTTLHTAGSANIPPSTSIAAVTANTAYTTHIVGRFLRLWCVTASVVGTAVITLRTAPFYAPVQNMNLVLANGSAPLTAIPNGAASVALGTIQATAISQIDQSGTAFAGSGRVNGTLVASTAGSGACVSAEINVTALVLGTASAGFMCLQECTGTGNLTDIWVSDPITTTGIIRMPAIPVNGRRRWSAFSVGGTSTTFTVTVNALELPSGYALQRQGRDAFAATNPFASMINNAAQTSTFVLTTLNTVTSVWSIEGCKNVTAFITLAGGPTVTTQPVITLQVSWDGTNWFSTTATMTAAGNGTYSASVSNVVARYARLAVTTAAAYSAGAYTITNCGMNAVN